MSRSEEEVLHEALTHFELMLEHAQRDVIDQLVVDAVCMRLSAGVETLNRLDPSVRDRMFGDSWPLMWGMRNRIAHGYLLRGSFDHSPDPGHGYSRDHQGRSDRPSLGAENVRRCRIQKWAGNPASSLSRTLGRLRPTGAKA